MYWINCNRIILCMYVYMYTWNNNNIMETTTTIMETTTTIIETTTTIQLDL